MYLNYIKFNMNKTDINLLKAKRKFSLLMKELTFNETHCNFLVKYNKELNISFNQYSRFGFIITYVVFYKNSKIILEFDEGNLIKPFDRKTMDELISTDFNKKKYEKTTGKTNLNKLKDIDY